MSFDDAVAELDGAIAQDAGPAPALTPTEQAPVAPVATPTGETQSTEVQPELSALARDEFGRFMAKTQEAQNEPGAEDTFDSGQFNPDLLPPELQPGWKQLQAAFTQKTQTLAERQRSLEEQASQFEGIDPSAAREALELYTALQDPDYLVQFHGELSQALQAQGLTKAEAEAVAAQQVEQAGGSTGNVSDTLSALRSDPELAPVADELTQLRQMVEQMNADRQSERAQQLEVQRQMAIAGEQIRQEAVLVENGFNDSQLRRVHELSGAFGGNLLQTAEIYRAIRQEALEDFVQQKSTVEAGVGALQGTGNSSVIPTEINSLDEGLLAALGHIAAAGIDKLDL